MISNNKVGMIMAKGFQLNKAKGLDSIIDADGSGLLGQNKVRYGRGSLSLVSTSSE